MSSGPIRRRKGSGRTCYNPLYWIRRFMELVRPDRETKRPTNGMSQMSDTAERALTMIQMHIAQCDDRHKAIQSRFDNVEVKIDTNRKANAKLTYIVMAIVLGTSGGGALINDNVLHFFKGLLF